MSIWWIIYALGFGGMTVFVLFAYFLSQRDLSVSHWLLNIVAIVLWPIPFAVFIWDWYWDQ